MYIRDDCYINFQDKSAQYSAIWVAMLAIIFRWFLSFGFPGHPQEIPQMIQAIPKSCQSIPSAVLQKTLYMKH